MADRKRCRVVTRVRGEQGRTTGVLDRGVGEKRKRERDAHTRMDKEAHGKAARQRRRHELSRRQSKEHKYMYIEDSNGYNRSGRRDGCRRLITHAHMGQDGDSAGSTRAFHGAESASREPTQRKLWRTTEKSSVHSPTALRSL